MLPFGEIRMMEHSASRFLVLLFLLQHILILDDIVSYFNCQGSQQSYD